MTYKNNTESSTLRLNQERPIPPSVARTIPPLRKPEWLKIRPPAGESYQNIKSMLRERGLHTVCEEARCPNVAECWSGGTATFMLGSDICTRACRFCAVKTSRRPPPLDPNEPENVGRSVADMKLQYVVLTSVDRDDLDDQGSNHFAKTIRIIKNLNPKMVVEALVPDFRGDETCVNTIVESGVDVYAHNIETVERLQYRVRDPRAGYRQSISTLVHAKKYGEAIGRSKVYTKTSIMLGLGETEAELKQAFADLRAADVDVLTLGQYLRPSMDHLPVEKYYSPEEFIALEKLAMTYGFLYVASGPMVRSSYKAAEFFIKGIIEKNRSNESERK
jgi:lipoic acid synthetase